MAAFCGRHGMAAASILADLLKFYELVSHDALRREAEAVGFNLRLLRALCVIYSSPRIALAGGCASEPFAVGGTIAAGCSCATGLAKVMLIGLLRLVRGSSPLVTVKNIVDDVGIMCYGTPERAARDLSRA